MEQMYASMPIVGTGTQTDPRRPETFASINILATAQVIRSEIGCYNADGTVFGDGERYKMPWMLVEDYGRSALCSCEVPDGTTAAVAARLATGGVVACIGTSKADLRSQITARRNQIFASLPAAVRTAISSGDARTMIRTWINNNTATAGDNFHASIRTWMLSLIDNDPGVIYPAVFLNADGTFNTANILRYATFLESRASTHKLVILSKVIELWSLHRALQDLA